MLMIKGLIDAALVKERYVQRKVTKKGSRKVRRRQELELWEAQRTRTGDKVNGEEEGWYERERGNKGPEMDGGGITHKKIKGMEELSQRARREELERELEIEEVAKWKTSNGEEPEVSR